MTQQTQSSLKTGTVATELPYPDKGGREGALPTTTRPGRHKTYLTKQCKCIICGKDLPRSARMDTPCSNVYAAFRKQYPRSTHEELVELTKKHRYKNSPKLNPSYKFSNETRGKPPGQSLSTSIH